MQFACAWHYTAVRLAIDSFFLEILFPVVKMHSRRALTTFWSDPLATLQSCEATNCAFPIEEHASPASFSGAKRVAPYPLLRLPLIYPARCCSSIALCIAHRASTLQASWPQINSCAQRVGLRKPRCCTRAGPALARAGRPKCPSSGACCRTREWAMRCAPQRHPRTATCDLSANAPPIARPLVRVESEFRLLISFRRTRG